MSQEKQNMRSSMERGINEWRELTPEEWERIAPLLASRKHSNREKVTNQEMVNALLYRHYIPTPWSKMPERFGNGMALAKRYTRWRDDGTLQLVFDELEKMGLITTAVEPSAQEEPEPEPDAPLEWWELTDEQWEAVANLLPPDPSQVYGNSWYKTNRQMLNAILYREYTKLPLRSLPDKYSHWQTINNRISQWQEDGTLQRVFEKLKELGALSKEKYELGQPTEETEPRLWWELTDEQWEHIEPLLPPELPRHGKKPKTNRQMLNAILCRYKTDTAWRDLPEKYGHWRTVNNRYTKWRDDGTLQRVLDELQKMDTPII